MYHSCIDIEDYFTLIPVGDVHLGNIASDITMFRDTVKRIKKYGYYWFSIGDLIEGIVPKDRRFDTSSIDPELIDPDTQMDKAIDILYGIKDTCLFCLTGNHEDTVRRRCGIDLTKKLADTLDVDYAGYNALIRFRHRDTVLDVFATHGTGSCRTDECKKRKVSSLASWIRADLYLHGHFHVKSAWRDVEYMAGEHSIVKRLRTYVLTGGFFEGYTDTVNLGYVERGLYKPHELGVPKINIDMVNGYVNGYVDVEGV